MLRRTFFKESADLLLPVDKMDFQNPVPRPPVASSLPDRRVIVGMSVERDFVLGNSFMRELADQMASHRPSEFPARLIAELNHLME